MSSDSGIKLFGKTIAMPFCSEEGGEDYYKCSPRDKEQQSKDPWNAEENQNDHKDKQEKPALKKPDKILACPRCKSMDTKFCYYNNYNINQPRHFCKNCQRYWTAGGTMRNVPVGAGRRRSKNSANSQFQHLIISDAALKANGGGGIGGGSSRVLSFGSDALPAVSNEHKTVTSNPIDYSNGAHLQWAPWPYPWAPPPTPVLWGYGTPWLSPMVMTSSSSSSAPTSGHVSQLEKHSRERDVVSKEYYEGDSGRKGNIWIPKTLRIDDPEEAAKSSIWATMGFDNEKSNKGLFKPFPKKSVEFKADSSSQLFDVNPASLSRSANFQEGS